LLRHQSHRTADVFTPTVRSMATAHSKQAAMPRSSESWTLWATSQTLCVLRNP